MSYPMFTVKSNLTEKQADNKLVFQLIRKVINR